MEIRVPKNTRFDRFYRIDSEENLSFRVEAGALLKIVLIALPAAGKAVGRIRVALEGEGAEAHLYGLFLAGAGECSEYYTDVEHLVPGCTSRQDFRGVASGDGAGLFEGRIRVAADAQHTQAFQYSKGLILGDLSSIQTRPQLEIYADDVKCSHGATIGQLDPQAIFYMRQRGIGEDEARKLQLHGFVHTIIDQIPSPETADAVDAMITAKIESL
jgi:Fe-S cluster assembly protein SufD